VVQAIQFEIEMSDVDVQIPIAINVGGIDSHTGFVATIFTCSKPGDQRHIVECTIVVVLEKEIWPGVIGDGNVGPSVIVQISYT